MGFLKRHSTTTNLIMPANDWTKPLENKELVQVFYIDFEKAFDMVPVDKLLHKLHHLGIQGQLFRSVASFLTNRMQSVIIDKVESNFLDRERQRQLL